MNLPLNRENNGEHLYTHAEGLCWTRTAERQASRMRRLYLEAVLRQEVEFFDAEEGATTFRVVSTISDDADAIQDFLGEKVTIDHL